MLTPVCAARLVGIGDDTSNQSAAGAQELQWRRRAGLNLQCQRPYLVLEQRRRSAFHDLRALSMHPTLLGTRYLWLLSGMFRMRLVRHETQNQPLGWFAGGGNPSLRF